MANTMMRADTKMFVDYTKVIKDGTRRVTRTVLSAMAKDAGLLARAHEPHNMSRSDITWRMTAIGPVIHAVGAPAGYNDAGRGITEGMRSKAFRHPVFADKNMKRELWTWRSQPNTKPFIEIAAREVAADADILMSTALQSMFDKA
jgi:hypothetical protein